MHGALLKRMVRKRTVRKHTVYGAETADAETWRSRANRSNGSVGVLAENHESEQNFTMFKLRRVINISLSSIPNV